jgi:hypothetical protein
MDYPKIYDLDFVHIRPHVKQKWETMCELTVIEVHKKNPNLNIAEISIEQFRETKTFFGNIVGEIFAQIGNKELIMRVPKNDYVIISKN